MICYVNTLVAFRIRLCVARIFLHVIKRRKGRGVTLESRRFAAYQKICETIELCHSYCTKKFFFPSRLKKKRTLRTFVYISFFLFTQISIGHFRNNRYSTAAKNKACVEAGIQNYNHNG